MKAVFVLSIAILGILSQNLVLGGIIEDIPFSHRSGRIASGVAAKKGENCDFCYLNAQFIQRSQTCGCAIYNNRWVVTSARCLVDTAEGVAKNVTVFINNLSGRSGVRFHSLIVIPDGKNGADAANAATLDAAYDPTKDTPFTTVAGSNIGMVRLSVPLSDKELDGKNVCKLKFPSGTDYDTFANTYNKKDWKIRVCGIGAIDNRGTRPKSLMCTDMEISKADDCKTIITVGTIQETTQAICLSYDTDNNVCAGDYGGPFYVYKYDSTGKIIEQYFAGVTAGSLNIRNNAPCQGGQTIVGTFFAGKIKNWIEGVDAGRVAP